MKALDGYTEASGWLYCLMATSPADFWSKWNPGVHNTYLCLLKFIRRATGSKICVIPAILFIFAFNGFLHDLIITKLILRDGGFPWTIFFLLQFVMVATERTFKVRLSWLSHIIKTLLTFGWIVVSLGIASVLNDYIFS